ncbi:34540_t:CDS:1, partial [Gigaspora margarita]
MDQKIENLLSKIEILSKAIKEDQVIFETVQMEAGECSDNTNLEKELGLEPEMVEEQQENQMTILNNRTTLPKENMIKKMQEFIKSALTNKCSLKGYGPQLLSHAYTGQEPATTESENPKYEKNDLIDTDIEGFITVSYKKATLMKKENSQYRKNTTRPSPYRNQRKEIPLTVIKSSNTTFYNNDH